MNTPQPEPKPRYPRPNTADRGMPPRDLALLNELYELRLALDRLTQTVDHRGAHVANAVGALVEQGDY